MQNTERGRASVRGIEGPTQPLSPRMRTEFLQVQPSNGVSLEVLTEGESAQALFITRRFWSVSLNPVNSDTKKPER